VKNSSVKDISRCLLIEPHHLAEKSENFKKTQWFKRMRQAYLLSYVIAYCLKNDRLAFNLVPDLIYSRGSLINAFRLFNYTKKCISFCNARLSPRVSELSDDEIISQEPKVLLFRFISADWLDARQNNLSSYAGTKFNFFMKYPEYFLLTPLGPNPMMVKFREEDLGMFLRNRTYAIWDDQWQEFLRKSNRLVVQTNLDLGMSVEIDNNSKIYSDTIVAFDCLFHEQFSEISNNIELGPVDFATAGRSMLVDPIRHALVFQGTAPESEFY